MANPLQALGNILQGKQSGGHDSANIFEAVLHDDPSAVEKFLSRGVRISELNQDGWSAVQVACWYDKLKALSSLLKWNPDLSLQDSAGRTGVHLAAFNGSVKCLRKILHAGANPDTCDKHSLTALHKASVAGQLSSMRTLLEYKANPALATADGLTPMHLAAWKGQREALRLLASQRVDLQARSHDGSTPLHEAVRSGDQSSVAFLLQLGSNPSIADRFGRTPADLAFAAGNRVVFALLHEATLKAAAATTAPQDTSDIPDPSEFWQYIKDTTAAAPAAKTTGTPGGTAAPQPDTQPLTPGQRPQVSLPETHPRKQFEAWLGGILFPQRQRSDQPVATGGSPYGTVNASAKPPPSLARPAFTQMMQEGRTTAPQHAVGHAGGSVFAARKTAQAQAAAAPPTSAAAARVETHSRCDASNVQLTLDPYEDHGPQPTAPSSAEATAGAAPVGGAHEAENPLAAMMQAIGRKAQKDIKTTMDGVASIVTSLPPPKPHGKPEAESSAKATKGDEEAYDSDEYDEAVQHKAEVGGRADVEDWGEFEDEEDDWGTTGAAALTAKKRAQRAAASEGRIYTVHEAREKLEQLDIATATAQGWLRGRSAQRRLAAMQMLISAYPEIEAPSAPVETHRVKAANPLAILTQGLWQQQPHQQEEEKLAVQAHLQTATVAASVKAQGAGDTPRPVPRIDFREAWTATDGFSSSNLLLEDVFGKVFRADIFGDTHALRVLDSSVYSPSDLSHFLGGAARLSHAHLVSVKGAAPDRGILVTDLPESGNLLYVLQTAVLPTTEPLSWSSCVDISLALASALQYLHNQPQQMAHGRLNAATVYFDRNAVAKVGDVGLEVLCSIKTIATGALRARDLHSLGEIMMQLLTLNTQPIDDSMRNSILDFVKSGQHIHPSDKLSWPQSIAATFEAVAVACMRAGDAEDTAKALNDGVIPALLSLRGETLKNMWKACPPAAKQRADGAFIATAAYRCPLTGEVMLDPVRAADGFVYERSAIEQWLTLGHKRSPMTNEPLSHPYLTPERDLRSAVQAWLQCQNGASAPIPA